MYMYRSPFTSSPKHLDTIYKQVVLEAYIYRSHSTSSCGDGLLLRRKPLGEKTAPIGRRAESLRK